MKVSGLPINRNDALILFPNGVLFVAMDDRRNRLQELKKLIYDLRACRADIPSLKPSGNLKEGNSASCGEIYEEKC